jgi:formate/nitrite transporter FocA (FNT family)
MQQTPNNLIEDPSTTGETSSESDHGIEDLFSADEIFQRVVATADAEIDRAPRLLFLSGLAAGLSIGLSFIARAAITGQVPEDIAGLAGNLLYPIGFILIVLGRYQLFTENTLTPVTLVLTRLTSVPTLLKNWSIVLAANVLGAAAIAFVLANTGIFDEETAAVARALSMHAFDFTWGTLFFKGIIAGWIVASMVWLVHAAGDAFSRLLIVYITMFLVPAADLFHCIIGACEAFYLVFIGAVGLGPAVGSFFLPVLLGNTIGGVLLVALLNYGHTQKERFPRRAAGDYRLGWREWLFGMHSGQLNVNSEQTSETR